ncbi:MAG: type II secretion system F family protein [Pirellulaceae bacterium]
MVHVLPTTLLVATGMFVFGFGLLWATGFVFAGQRGRDYASTAFLLRAAGAVIMILSGSCYLGASLGWGAILCVLMAPFIVVIMWLRALSHQRRCLLQITARAATLGISATEILEAYRIDQSNQWSRSCTVLLHHLRRGFGLGESIGRTFWFMPTDAHVATRCLLHTDDMGELLSESLAPEDPLHQALRRMAEIVLYLGCVLAVLMLIISGMIVFIVPQFRMVFDDFSIELPALSKFAFEIVPPIFLVMSGPIMLCLSAIILWGICLYFDVIPSSVPVIDRLSNRLNVSRLLAILGRDVRRGEGITTTLDRLGRFYPHRYFARKVARVANLVCGGMVWIDALSKEKLLATSEATALRSAEKADNLDWALTAISESIRRKVVRRMHRMLGLLGPLSIVVLASIIGLFVIGFMEPLIELIYQLPRVSE